MIIGKLNGTTIGQFQARNRRLKWMGFRSYADYLASDEWKALKFFAFRKKEFQTCFVCGIDKKLLLHHRRYTNIHNRKSFIRRLRDLIAVCHPCHERIHLDNLNSPGRGLKASARHVRRQFKLQNLYG